MVVPSLRDDLILTADAVDRLFAADAKLSCVSTRSMAHRSVRWERLHNLNSHKNL